MVDKNAVIRLWQSADCVCFDVDSTVCLDEAIDELAKYLGAGEAVADLTRAAMQGGMTYKQSLAARLELMKPSRHAISSFLTEQPPKLTPGMKDLVKKLHEMSIPVYLVSGGFTCIIENVAALLEIPNERIYANKLLFYYDGTYAGFDEKQHTSETGGKPKVIQELKDKFGYKTVVHIGDGVTDMEACPPADAFIGFGANQVRDKVKNGCQWFAMDFDEMIENLERP
jgi:phosphoserine phosphatase